MTKVFLTQLKKGKAESREVKVKLQLGFDGMWPRLLPPPKTMSILWRPVRGVALAITSSQKRTAMQSVFVSNYKGYDSVHPVRQCTPVKHCWAIRGDTNFCHPLLSWTKLLSHQLFTLLPYRYLILSSSSSLWCLCVDMVHLQQWEDNCKSAVSLHHVCPGHEVKSSCLVTRAFTCWAFYSPPCLCIKRSQKPNYSLTI